MGADNVDAAAGGRRGQGRVRGEFKEGLEEGGTRLRPLSGRCVTDPCPSMMKKPMIAWGSAALCVRAPMTTCLEIGGDRWRSVEINGRSGEVARASADDDLVVAAVEPRCGVARAVLLVELEEQLHVPRLPRRRRASEAATEAIRATAQAWRRRGCQWHSVALGGTRRHSVALGGIRWPSVEAARKAVDATRSHREPSGAVTH